MQKEITKHRQNVSGQLRGFWPLSGGGYTENSLSPFMHNVVKWPNILKKYCAVKIARFLKYV